MNKEITSAYTIINQIKKDAPGLNIELNDEQMSIFKLTKDIKRVKYKKGTVIIHKGQKMQNLLFIAKGFIMMYKDANHKRMFTRLYASGDFIGMMGFSEFREFQYSLATLEETIVYQIPLDNFKDNVYKNSKLIKWVTDSLVKGIYMAYKKYEMVTCHNMEGRIAQSFLYFSNNMFKKDSFDLPITKKQLGYYANVSPENVTRILKTLQSKKIIHIKGKHYDILDKEALRDLCETC